MPSRMITTSRPSSTRRLARSMASSATAVCSSAGRSKVEATTSPRTERRMSVTSSGRSSTSRTMRWTSGLFASIEWAICFMTVVLPAFGGETIRPRWPLPIGEIRSTMRAVRLAGSPGSSRRSVESGKRGVRSSKRGRWRASSGESPPTESMRMSAGYFSLGPAGRHAPSIASPLPEGEAPGLAHRDVDVLRARQVAARAQEAVALLAQVEQALDRHELTLPGDLRAALDLAPLAPLAAAAPAAPAVAGLALAAAVLSAVLLVLLALRTAAFAIPAGVARRAPGTAGLARTRLGSVAARRGRRRGGRRRGGVARRGVVPRGVGATGGGPLVPGGELGRRRRCGGGDPGSGTLARAV